MIQGIGLDAVEIKRFHNYREKSKKELSRIFSQKEIAYCLQEPQKSSERFAVRFAAKEACFKALSQALNKTPCPFLYFCKQCSVKTDSKTKIPFLQINWNNLKQKKLSSFLTLTHTKNTAIAQVILQKFDNV